MITVRRTIPVGRTLDEVFAYLSDFTHTTEWDPATVSCTRLDTGPIGVGSRFRYVGTFRGRQNELEYSLEYLDPGQRLVFVGRNSSVTATDDLTFEQRNGTTTVNYTAQLAFRGVLRLASPLLKSTFEQMGDDVAARLPEAPAR